MNISKRKIMTRCLLVLCSVLSTALPAAAQALPAAATPDLSAYLAIVGPVVTGNLSTGKTGNTYLPVTVEFQNVGLKTITAFTVAFDATFPDGHVDSSTQSTTDLVFNIPGAATPGGITTNPRPTLQPGESYELKQGIILRGEMPQLPVKVAPRVLVLVFLDRTALGGTKEVADVFKMRTSLAENMEAMIAQVLQAESAANPDAAYAAQIAANRSRVAAHLYVGVGEADLQRYRKAHGWKELFQAMLSVDQNLAKVAREHSMPAAPAQEIHQ
jgi:hypothetical protein